MARLNVRRSEYGALVPEELLESLLIASALVVVCADAPMTISIRTEGVLDVARRLHATGLLMCDLAVADGPWSDWQEVG